LGPDLPNYMTTSLPAPPLCCYRPPGFRVSKACDIDTLTQVLRYKSSGILHSVDRLTAIEVTKEQISSIFQRQVVLEECSTLTTEAIRSP